MKEANILYKDGNYKFISGINDNFILYGFNSESISNLPRNFPELAGMAAIYIVLGVSELGERVSYVGQSRTNVMNRLIVHKKNKEYFDFGYIIATKNNQLSPSQIDALEQVYIYHMSHSIYQIDNKVSAPNSKKISSISRDILFLSERVNEAINTFNSDIFSTKKKASNSNRSNTYNIINIDDFDLDFETYDNLSLEDSLSLIFDYQGLKYELSYDSSDPENIVIINKLSNKYNAFFYRIDDVNFYINDDYTLDLFLPDGTKMFDIDISVLNFFISNKIFKDDDTISKYKNIAYKYFNNN